MERMTSRLRRLISEGGLIQAPSCYDPLTARIAVQEGFPCVALGGYALGAHLTTTEPLLTMTEVVEAAGRIASSIDAPLVVDGGAGFGEPLHTMRTVRELERAGVAAVHIEDQIFPKRAHYHREYREHTIPAGELADKIRFACQARQDPDFVIIARTDAIQTEDFEEGMHRARLCAKAGADMVMLFPRDDEEARRAPRECDVPLVYVNSIGNRAGRPYYSADQLTELGYRMVVDAISSVVVVSSAIRDLFARLRETGLAGIEPSTAIETRRALEVIIGLDEHYRIEEQTVERNRPDLGHDR